MDDQPTAGTASPHRRLQHGAEILAAWSEHARQTHKNAVHAALFSMLDRTLTRTHHVTADPWRPGEFSVTLKPGLALRLRVNGADSFDLLRIGPPEFTRA